MPSSHEEIRRIIEHNHNSMADHLSRLKADQAGQSLANPNDYMSLVNHHLKKHPDVSKAEAMRQVTRKHPKAHEAWIRKVNSQK